MKVWNAISFFKSIVSQENLYPPTIFGKR